MLVGKKTLGFQGRSLTRLLYMNGEGRLWWSAACFRDHVGKSRVHFSIIENPVMIILRWAASLKYILKCLKVPEVWGNLSCSIFLLLYLKTIMHYCNKSTRKCTQSAYFSKSLHSFTKRKVNYLIKTMWLVTSLEILQIQLEKKPPLLMMGQGLCLFVCEARINRRRECYLELTQGEVRRWVLSPQRLPGKDNMEVHNWCFLVGAFLDGVLSTQHWIVT